MDVKLKSKAHYKNMCFLFWSHFGRVWLQSFIYFIMCLKGQQNFSDKLSRSMKNADFFAEFKYIEKVIKSFTLKHLLNTRLFRRFLAISCGIKNLKNSLTSGLLTNQKHLHT
jgi:hypothetical protein